MISTDDRLAFLVRFAQMNLKHLRQAEVERLRSELKKFVQQGPGPTHPTKRQMWAIVGETAYLKPLTPENLEKLQQAVNELLTKLVQKEKTGGGMLVSSTPPFQLSVSYRLFCPERERILYIGGPTPDVVLAILHLLLITGGYDKIRYCPAPKPRTPNEQCKRLFVRVRKQQYCSEQCGDRVRKRKA